MNTFIQKEGGKVRNANDTATAPYSSSKLTKTRACADYVSMLPARLYECIDPIRWLVAPFYSLLDPATRSWHYYSLLPVRSHFLNRQHISR